MLKKLQSDKNVKVNRMITLSEENEVITEEKKLIVWLKLNYDFVNDIQTWKNCAPDADPARSDGKNLWGVPDFLSVHILY